MTQYVSDFYSLVHQWQDKCAEKESDVVVITGSPDDLITSRGYRTDVYIKNVRYEGNGDALDTPGLVTTDSNTNGTDRDQTTVFKYTKTTTTSFTWTLKEGVKLGLKTEFDVGVPPIASAKTTLSAELSFDATQGQTKTDTVTWQIDRNVIVPAHTHVDMTWTIVEKKITATFFADVHISGSVSVGGEDWECTRPLDEAFKDMKEWGIDVPSQYTVDNYRGEVIYKASGECKGKLGMQTTFNLKQSTPNKIMESRDITFFA